MTTGKPRRKTFPEAVGLMMLLAGTLSAQQTDNYELRAVPASRPVAVDGRLDDWDLSGEILSCSDVGEVLDRYAVRTAAMHDGDNLYLSFRFVDDSPLVNNVNPRTDPGGGWRGDSVEIRALVDGRSAHFETWYYTPRQTPAVHLRYGLDEKDPAYGVVADALTAGVREAFQAHEDGRGYTQELAIPWKLLTKDGRSLKAGDQMKLGLQMNWGDASGGLMTGMPAFRCVDLINPERPQREFFWANPNAWGTLNLLVGGNVAPSPSTKLPSLTERLADKRYSTSGPVAIEYELPADGFATLIIETPDGKRVRNFISDYPRKKGKNIDYWDGRDDEGRLAAPGDYRVRGLFHEDLDVAYEFSFGNPNPMTEPTADGKGGWLSNHCNNMAVFADATHIYAAASECEGPYPLIALDYAGDKVWGGLARWHAGFMARHGKHLYVVNNQDVRPARRAEELDDPAKIELVRIDPATGREVPFPDGNSKHVIATWNLQRQGAAKRRLGWTIEHRAFNADWPGDNCQGVATLGDRLYASLHFDDKLLVIDPATGEVTGKIPVARPAGIDSDGRRLLVISGPSVVVVDPVARVATPLIRDHLSAPIDLAIDSKGNIYVSDWADQMCVKVFTPAGAYAKTIGTPGGRPWVGDYDQRGMLMPRGIAVDAGDRLWVAEFDSSPRRISCWDTATGRLALEKLGRGRYGGMGYYVFPDDPERAICMNNLLQLDWKKGVWRVLGTLWRPTTADAALGFDPYARFGRILHHGGRRYLSHGALRPQASPTVISELRDGRAIPIAAVGYCGQAISHVSQQCIGGVEPDPVFADHLWTEPAVQKSAEKLVPWFFRGPRAGDPGAVAGHWNRLRIWGGAREFGLRATGQPKSNGAPNTDFLWSDLDGDGRVQPGEMHYFATPGLPGPLPVPWHTESWANAVVGDDFTLFVSAVQDGKSHHYRVPVSRWTDDGVPVYEPDKAELIVASPYMGEAAWLTADGNLLTLGNIPGKDRPGGLRDPLVAFRPDGSIAWTFPSPWTGVHGSHTAPKEKRGQLVGPLGVFGSAELPGVGRVFAFHTNVGTVEIFTDDGLYLGRLFRDGRSAPDPWPERPRRGQSIAACSTGGEWFGGQFFQRPDGRMFVVCSRNAGLVAEIRGLETARRLGAQSIVFSPGQYEQAQRLPAETGEDRTEVRSMRVAAVRPPPAAPPALDAFRWDAKHSASWRYDESRAARASWGYDDKNLYVAFQVDDDTPMVNGGEDVRQLFKFGDAAILELRTDPAQKSDQAAKGDLRLLFSVRNGKPVAVLYDYVNPDTTKRIELASVKTTRIDRFEVLEKARIKLDREDGKYTLCATVPLESIGWKPEPGKTYPGDFGIVYSDKAGRINELRMYWSNQATGIVSDLSLEADIQPANWGRFEVEVTDAP